MGRGGHQFGRALHSRLRHRGAARFEAKSIAYSDSASGVYISTELFQRLAIADQVKGKSRMITGESALPFLSVRGS